MQSDFVLPLLGFAEGFVLILSPCILPILPIIVASSLANQTRTRPLGIVVGFVMVFALIALFSREIVRDLGVDLNVLRNVAYVLLLILGIIMLSPQWTASIRNKLASWIGLNVKLIPSHSGGFGSGVYTGGLVAIVWTPCAGPILAALIVQVVTGETNALSFLTLLSFSLGVALPMISIALYSKHLVNHIEFFKRHGLAVRRGLGVILLAGVAWLLWQNTFINSTPASPNQIKIANALQDGLWHPYPAPPIEGISDWINTTPIAISSQKNKVILVDFWTYSCINCLRTVPHLKALDELYRDQGLVIVGVHSPEFEFEHNVKNVQRAVTRNGIRYPVAIDNHFITWQNYKNKYWPAQYLIDKSGRVVYQHMGEGDMNVLDNNIRFLLGADQLQLSKHDHQDHDSFFQTPETYLGYKRANRSYAPQLYQNQPHMYEFTPNMQRNEWSLKGKWRVNQDNIVASQAHATLRIHFKAKNVYVVMGHQDARPIRVTARLNGEPLTRFAGKAVEDGKIIVQDHTLYAVIALPQAEEGTLELEAEQPGLELYTLTFGS